MNNSSMIKKGDVSVVLPITINNENGGYWGECLVFPGCFSDGNTLDEFSNNMGEAISSYMEAIEEGMFDVSNIGLLKINISENGQIETNIMKKIDRNSYKALSYSKTS